MFPTFESIRKIVGSGKILAQEPQALQLRYLQTLFNFAEKKYSTIVFPLPIEMLNVLQKMLK